MHGVSVTFVTGRILDFFLQNRGGITMNRSFARAFQFVPTHLIVFDIYWSLMCLFQFSYIDCSFEHSQI